MCEKRSRKIKRGSLINRQREVRRVQRIQRLMSPPPAMPVGRLPASPCPLPQVIDKNAQCRLILELAWKTITLMQKNSVIQQRIVALQKETSEFLATVMNNPENRKRYAEKIRLYGQHPPAPAQPSEINDTHLKL